MNILRRSRAVNGCDFAAQLDRTATAVRILCWVHPVEHNSTAILSARMLLCHCSIGDAGSSDVPFTATSALGPRRSRLNNFARMPYAIADPE